MSEYEIKVGVTLQFDAEREKDIIEKVENLIDRRKISEFMTSIIRAVLDKDKAMQMLGSKTGEYGISDEREQFFKGIEAEVSKMRHKIDTIFDMASKVYTLAQFGKRLGIEKKADNMIQAQFVLQKQLDELCSTLGISTTGYIYESDRIEAFKTRADDVLEYIIDAYDNIVAEIKSHISYSNATKYQEVGHDGYKSNDSHVVDSGNNTNKSFNGGESDNTRKQEQIDKTTIHSINMGIDQNKSSEVLYNKEDDSKEDDEIIDFGAVADFEALAKFVGG